MTWKTTGPDFNRWNLDFLSFAKLLDDNSDTHFWTGDPELKYLNIRVDTRGAAFILTDRDGNRISPDRVVSAIERTKAF